MHDQVVPRRERRWPPLSRRRLLLGGLLLLLLLAGGALGTAATRHLAAAQEHLQHAGAALRANSPVDLTPGQLATARADLLAAAADVQATRTIAGPLLALAPALGWLPQVGGDIRQLRALLLLAEDSCRVGAGLIAAGTPALAALPHPPPAAPRVGDAAADLAAMIAALETDPTALDPLRAAVSQAKADREQIDAGSLGVPWIRANVAKFDRYLPLLDHALGHLAGMAHALNVLLGHNGPITLLILMQNPDELRPTGGFISAVGLITADKGHFARVEFRDSYSVDRHDRAPVPPPADLARYMGAGGWYIRDANWAPDFPRTAQAAETFYQIDQGVTVDGTIAVDQQMLRLMLEALGPQNVPNYPTPVDADNAIRLIQDYYFRPAPGDADGDWWFRRKDFMRDLFGLLAQELPTLSPDKMLALAGAVQQALDEKHLLISVHEPAAARWLARAGWDGALGPAPGDSLALVDSNLGFNKVNPHIAVRLDYTVTLGAAASTPPSATLTLTYRNASPPIAGPCVQESRLTDYRDLTNGCYWDYLRLYVPAGARLITARWDAHPDPIQVQAGLAYGLLALSDFFSLAPHQARTLTLRYELPATAVQRAPGRGTYNLAARKQPGNDSMLLALAVRPPPGMPPDLPPDAQAGADGWVRFAPAVLTRDRTFRVGWQEK